MSLMPPREMTNTLLQELVDKLSNSVQSAGMTPAQLETILTKVGLSTAEGMRQSLRPENADCTHISAFFTTADLAKYGSFEQRPLLKRKTFFVGSEEQNERLTTSEIEAYNKIDEYRECRNGKWTATIKRNGQHEELWVSVPCETVDQRMDIPSLLLILHELNGGVSTNNVHSLIKQIEALRGLAVKQGATVAELEATLVANA